MTKFTKLIYEELTYKVNGILFNIHNQLGRFCNEKQYSDATELALKDSGLEYEREKVLPKAFEGERQGRNKVDFLIASKLILEIKAKRILSKDDYYQVLRYLSALNLKLGLLVNFRQKHLKPKRILNSSAKE